MICLRFVILINFLSKQRNSISEKINLYLFISKQGKKDYGAQLNNQFNWFATLPNEQVSDVLRHMFLNSCISENVVDWFIVN